MTRRARKVSEEEWINKKAEIKEKKAELSKLAASLFYPVGKNPYYLNRGSSSGVHDDHDKEPVCVERQP